MENKGKKEKILGTNCYNCKFISRDEKPVDAKVLNDEGGIDPKSKEELERAEKADLITLPGGSKADAASKMFCSYENIKMYATVRMCCAYWDNDGVKRPWKKS
jgi:hypothetical protein